jgi:hypothetical protein
MNNITYNYVYLSIYRFLQPGMLADEADEYSVSRSLEAYLLWLFGSIMFCNGHGNSVDKILLVYAREIADAQAEEDVPTWSWGAAVLACTYHALCEACVKTEPNGLITGCPLLLQLWAYVRIAVGRPVVSLAAYEEALYEDDNDDTWPTMGTIWMRPHSVRFFYFYSRFFSLTMQYITSSYILQRHWAPSQTRRSYPEFIRELDQLQPDDMVWEPYSAEAIGARAPLGLAGWCGANPGLWLTRAALVYDIYVEPHCPDRVMRQFGLRQLFPLPAPLNRVPRQDHR